MASPSAPTAPRASTGLGLFSLAGIGLSGLVILFFCLAEPAPMDGLLTVVLMAAVALVPLSWLAALGALLTDVLARRRARREPDRHGTPRSAGSIMALASLVLSLGVLLLPGLVPPRGGSAGRAMDKAAAMNLEESISGLATAFTQARQEGVPAEERRAPMEAWLATIGNLRNPCLRKGPAVRPSLTVAGKNPDETRRQAVAEAITLGEVVLVLSEPGTERCLAGAVLTRGIYKPPPGDPAPSVVPVEGGQVLLRSVLLAD